MTEQQRSPQQTGWTRIFTPSGRYEYQFQGSGPAVRNGAYLEARDYQFLVMNEEGWLFRIPVCVSAEAEEEIRQAGESGKEQAPDAVRAAEAQLRAGLQNFRPRENAPFDELDRYFAVSRERARELLRGSS